MTESKLTDLLEEAFVRCRILDVAGVPAAR